MHQQSLPIMGGPPSRHDVQFELEACKKRLSYLMELPWIYAAEVTDELHRLYEEGRASRIYKVWPLGKNVKPQDGGDYPAWFTSNPQKNTFVVCIGDSRVGEKHTREEIDAWLNMLLNHNPH